MFWRALRFCESFVCFFFKLTLEHGRKVCPVTLHIEAVPDKNSYANGDYD